MRGELRGAFGWRVNRLSDRMTSLEVFGSAMGYALSLFFLAGTAVLIFSGIGSPVLIIAALVGAVLFFGLTSLSTGHFLYRAWLRRRLATRGVPATATVVDRWRLPSDGGAWSCIRFRFNAAGAPIEAVACDSTELVRHIAMGTLIKLRYDPDDPRLLLIRGAI